MNQIPGNEVQVQFYFWVFMGTVGLSPQQLARLILNLLPPNGRAASVPFHNPVFI